MVRLENSTWHFLVGREKKHCRRHFDHRGVALVASRREPRWLCAEIECRALILAFFAAVEHQISCDSHYSSAEEVLMVQSAVSALVAGSDETGHVHQAHVDHKEARPTRTRFWACRRHPSIRLSRSDAWSAG